MPSINPRSKIESTGSGNLVTPADKDILYRHTWRNWFLLSGVLVLTSIGLASAIPPLLSERHFNPWPWMKTDLVLLVGLSLTVLIFVAYLTQQQRVAMRMHKRFLALQEGYEQRLVRHTSRMYALASISRIMSVENDRAEHPPEHYEHMRRDVQLPSIVPHASRPAEERARRALGVRSQRYGA